MARLGEGDPRWLVENRNDGKNVNNWHWSEKNLYNWANERLVAALNEQVIFQNEDLKIVVTKLDPLKGTVVLNTRKGKNKFMWDVEIFLDWTATFSSSEVQLNGRLECSEITAVDNIYYTNITCSNQNCPEYRTVYNILKENGGKFVKGKWDELVQNMMDSFKDPVVSPSNAPTGNHATDSGVKQVNTAPECVKTSSGQKISVRSIQKRFRFYVPSHILFETLLDPQRISVFTGSPAYISDKVGSEFKLFGGNISGILQLVEAPKKIVQKWRFSSWPVNHYSIVSFILEPSGSDFCDVMIEQHGIPDNDFERTSSGWQQHYWHRIKAAFGWEYTMIY